jgi:hypothetical protein
MAAGRYSFTIEEGATLNIQIDWSDENGTPIDLTDYHARMQIRPSIESNDIILNLSSSFDEDGSGISLRGGSGDIPLESGSIAIQISANASVGLDFKDAYYDLEMVKGDTVVRLLEGRVKLSKNVTR